LDVQIPPPTTFELKRATSTSAPSVSARSRSFLELSFDKVGDLPFDIAPARITGKDVDEVGFCSETCGTLALPRILDAKSPDGPVTVPLQGRGTEDH
jgi:hypothetical protein